MGTLGAGTNFDGVIRYLADGTAAHTGEAFFAALVKHVALALGVDGAWVTEISADGRRLRALAFWFRDGYVEDYEYCVEGTPCAPVVELCRLFHVPENVIGLFPGDPDLARLGAVSYLGLPLLDGTGRVMGHLAALDGKRMELDERVEGIFRIFGARAGAEIERLRAEARVRARDRELASVFDGAWEAIVVVDGAGRIRQMNRAGERKLGDLRGGTLGVALPEAGGAGEFEVPGADGGRLRVEATVTGFERDGEALRAVILRDLGEARTVEGMAGESEAMRRVFELMRRVAATDATVLITGETGTGKELVARGIHELSPRRGRPMVGVNCGAIPAPLLESEFFGHEKGAFTGATERREGRFARADGGTLFLDEIGELGLDLQVKLLRVLQEGEFEPVGSGRTRKVDVRVVAATNRDLLEEVRAGRFRADLYYRLHVFPIAVPALRERGEDVIRLAELFLERLGRKMGRRFGRLSPAARGRLLAYGWPGNVRELENVVERAAILARGSEVDFDVLAGGRVEPGERRVVLTAAELAALERENLERALEACGGKVAGEAGAARLVGVPPSTFASRMKALGVKRRES